MFPPNFCPLTGHQTSKLDLQNYFTWTGALLLAVFFSPLAYADIYTCVDANGRKITSDRPIAECTGREQRQLGNNGFEIRRIGPTLSAKEQEALAEQKRQQKIQREKEELEKRHLNTLYARYPNKAAHDAARVDALTGLNNSLQISQRRLGELLQEQTQYNKDIKKYGDVQKAPPLLQSQLSAVTQNIASQQRFINIQEAEKQRIISTFDADAAKLSTLWGSDSPSTAAKGGVAKQ